MKIAYSWLNEQISIAQYTPEQISTLLTSCGLEVEQLELYQSIRGGLQGVVIGKVLERQKHPNADKLSVCRVDIGTAEPKQIVCGAPNVAAGQTVLVATVGATLYPTHGDAFTIGKSKIRGEVSEGMICAEDELGLGESHAGIMVLPEHLQAGMPASEYFSVYSDWIFEIGLTANRGDATGHLGVARDLRALTGIPLNSTNSTINESTTSSPIQVLIEDTDCIRYSGLALSGITVRESPEWLKNRLRSIGLNPINAVVDATNYVLFETGQPLHAFDSSRLKGNTIRVRKAAGEKIITLDGVERTLKGNECMICDAESPIAIAGVFGGKDSGVQSDTHSIFIESACFRPESVRKTARQHGLSTDASYRFERGSDPEITIQALKRVASLIMEITGAEVQGAIVDIYPEAVVVPPISFSLQRCHSLIGKEIPTDTIRTILTHLDIQIVSENNGLWTLQAPAYKPDVRREADVIEEILRIYGLNNIEDSGSIRMSTGASDDSAFYRFRNKYCAYLAHAGFQEVATNSLTPSHWFDATEQEKAVKILNPLSSDLDTMRPDMLPGMLEAIRYNVNRKQSDLRLVESAKTYELNGEMHSGLPGYLEKHHLVLAMSGNTQPESWNNPVRKQDVFSLKSALMDLFSYLRIPAIDMQTAVHAKLENALEIRSGKMVLGYAGKVSKAVLKKMDVSVDVMYADLDAEKLAQASMSNVFKRRDVSVFPAVRRDLALLLDESVNYAQIVALVRKTQNQQLREINLFDVYRGDKIPAGKKSYALSFVLQDDQKTLTDEESDGYMQKLVQLFEKELQASLRA